VSHSLNMCIHMCKVERELRQNDTITRDKYVQCSLGDHRALQIKGVRCVGILESALQCRWITMPAGYLVRHLTI